MMARFLLTDRQTGEIVFEGAPVSRRARCPICDKDSWCLLDTDRQVVICPRTESRRKIGDAGWMHSVGGELPSKRIEFRTPPHVLEPLEGAGAMQEKFSKASVDRLPLLAFELGVSIESLLYLSTGWNGLWTFPMRSASDEIVGFRTRTPDGRKYSIKGSRSGLFIPRCAVRKGHVVVVEGVSDVAAMIDMGFNVIGRPSCRGCEEEVARWTRGMEVTIVADDDEPGIAGAESLMQTVAGSALRVEMILPPKGLKDCREALNHGLTRDDWTSTSRIYASRRSSNGPRA